MALKPASKLPMDKIKPLKNFVLSRESKRVALDAFRAGRSVTDATREVVQIITPRQASAPSSLELIVIEEPVGDVQLARTEVAPTFEGVPEENTEVVPASDDRAPEGGGEVEVAPTAKGTSKDGAKSRSISAAPRPKKAAASGAATLTKTTGKRAPPAKVLTAAPASKKAHTSQQSASVLPPAEKEKAPVGLLSFALNNEALNADEITP
ncbi:uncharacterized protein LOC122724429 [Manihot esculenta]|uniref:uncharacterized protein LOC122724429 n=1 Tax=Manihot esculenta TaxID=3983 RepID=UPI001CC3B37C|nr:uncharacterized protein LOC122724429 [Manihot esculenta]